ncbi:MAG: ATP-binding protein [Pseudomonadota bacterium]
MKSRFSQIRFKFQLTLGLQIVLLGVALAGLIWSATVARLPAVSAVLGLVTLGVFAGLLAYASSGHRKLERFLDALAFDDLSLRLSEQDWDQQLARAANHVLGSVRDARVETEAKATYLDVLVKHVPVAVLSLAADGRIALQNNAARHLFQLPRLSRVDDLAVFGAHLPKALTAIAPGRQELVRAVRDEHVLELKVSATEIRLAGDAGGDVQTLLAIENIRSELDDREINAWRDLIRVLTHEIMNSVTPITSLARTVDTLAADVGTTDDPEELLEDMQAALATIVRRSEGLTQFVEGYRKLTALPQPRIETVPLLATLADVRRLCHQDFGDSLTIEVDVDPDRLALQADPALVQQALINLARNACFAVEGRPEPRVRLVARSVHGRLQVSVEDNGCGIAPEEIDQIFIPFFTTRKDGSGVGMPLARQIMAAHGGTIGVQSRVDEGTTVTLTF